MKHLILSLAVLSVISLSALAGPENNGPQRKRIFDFPKELNLNADQQKKVESLNAEFKTKMEEMRKKLDELRSSNQEDMKSLFEQHQKAINELLTPEQVAKWKEMMSKQGMRNKFAPGKDSIQDRSAGPEDGKMNPKMRNEFGPQGFGMDHQMRGGFDRMGRGMDRGIRSDFGRRGAIGQGMSQGCCCPCCNKGMSPEKKNPLAGLKLTDEQKKQVKELNEKFRTEKKALNKKHQSAIEKILTPEQQSVLKERQKMAPKNMKANKKIQIKTTKGVKATKDVKDTPKGTKAVKAK